MPDKPNSIDNALRLGLSRNLKKGINDMKGMKIMMNLLKVFGCTNYPNLNNIREMQ